MIAESTRVDQMEEPVASTDAEDSTLQTSTAEPSIVKSVPEVMISDAATVTILEVSVTTSASKEPAAGMSLRSVKWFLPLRRPFARS